VALALLTRRALGSLASVRLSRGCPMCAPFQRARSSACASVTWVSNESASQEP
jgi:hypothetical protein